MSENTPLVRILEHALTGAALRECFFRKEAQHINNVALRLAATFAKDGKLLLCGNGGSAADCQHLAAEFINRFVIDRPPLPAIALTTDTSALTAIGNDFHFDEVFSKQVQALGREEDVLIAISTSGNSENVLHALRSAKKNNLITVGLAGKDGGAMAALCDTCFLVDESRTALIQEIHIALGHLLCSLTDYYLFENVAELAPYLQGEKNLPF